MGRFEDYLSVWQGPLPFAVKHDAVCLEGSIELQQQTRHADGDHISMVVLRLKAAAQQNLLSCLDSSTCFSCQNEINHFLARMVTSDSGRCIMVQ